MSQAGDLDNGSISPDIPTEFVADMGSAVPIANVIEILGDIVIAGTVPVFTTASGNTLITNVQISQAIPTTNMNNIGLAAFDSSDFSVDVNGFVSFIGDTGLLTLTGNSGGAISPTAGNINIITSNSTTSFVGAGSTLTVDYNLVNLVFGSSLPSLAGGNNNVGLGSNVLGNITSGTDNTAVGASALQAVNIGTLNTAVGSAAAASITSGSNNNAFGRNSLLGCSTGSNNCAMGFGALGNCNSSSNTAIGHLASVNITSGSLNTSYGANSLFAASSGSNNTSIGYSTLVACNGSDNVVLGLNAGQSYTGTESSNLLLANSGTLAESNTIRIGTQGSGGGQQNRLFAAGITGVTVSGSAPVGVNTNGQLSSLGFGTSGQILTSNGAATSPTFQTLIVGQTITGNTGGALSPTAGNWNLVTQNSTPIFSGATSTLTLDFGITNLVLGSSLPSLTSGTLNTGVGNNVLNTITSAIGNVAIGNLASDATTTGSFNISLGGNSLTSNISSSSNTSCGFSSLSSLVSGVGRNVSIGLNSSGSLGTGTDNIVVGSDSGSAFNSSESSNIIIGNAGVISESNAIRIGTAGSGSGQQNKAFVAGITGVTVAASAPVAVNTNGQLSSLGFGTSGQVLTSNGAGTSPTFQPVASSGMTWTEVSGAFASAVNNGYIVTNTASTTLPASPTVGQTIQFIVDTTNILTVTANTGQIFRLNTTVSATAGTAVNVARGCAITFVYAPTSASWIASASEGNWTLT